MGRYRYKKGRAGEDIACDYLIKKGFTLIEQNFRTKWGEVDLVMEDGETLVFIEVKFGYSGKRGRPIERITRAKKRNFVNTVKYYLLTKKIENRPIRIDVVEIIQGAEGLEFFHYPNAFGE